MAFYDFPIHVSDRILLNQNNVNKVELNSLKTSHSLEKPILTKVACNLYSEAGRLECFLSCLQMSVVSLSFSFNIYHLLSSSFPLLCVSGKNTRSRISVVGDRDAIFIWFLAKLRQ